MKTFAIILLFASASSAQSQQFGDDNHGGSWLPIPDGYTWPTAAEKAPDFKSNWKNLADLKTAHRKAIEGNWPGDEKPPERVEISEVDLNGDGRPEIFVGIPSYGGTGGTFYEILSTKDGKTYTCVGDTQGWGFKFLVRKNGWFQIEGMSRCGGGNYTRYLMTFVGKGYKTTRIEGHDFNAGKVTVGKTKAEQNGAGQPDIAPESKQEGKDKPKPKPKPAPPVTAGRPDY